jgi:Transposase IS200 like
MRKGEGAWLLPGFPTRPMLACWCGAMPSNPTMENRPVLLLPAPKCEGAWLQPCHPAPQWRRAFSPRVPPMSTLSRNADPKHILSTNRTFFVTTQTWMRKRLLQSERNAMLLIDILRSCVRARRFTLHDFVIMPDHIHLLLTTSPDVTLEKGHAVHQGRLLLSTEARKRLHR